MGTAVWSTQQLAEFVASVSSADSEAAAALAAVERAAEALDADVAAIVAGGEVVAAVGYPEGAAPAPDLEAVKPGVVGRSLEVPGIGPCVAAAATLEHPPSATLVVARREGLTVEESGLLRAMARVASLTMRMQRLLEEERAAREELEELGRGHESLRRVATLVAEAAAPDAVFSAVAEEVAELSEADIAKVLRYEADDQATVVGSSGDPEQHLPVGKTFTVAGEGVAVHVRRTGHSASVVRVSGPPGSVADAFSRAGVQVGSGSPIVVEGRLWGVVIAARSRPEPLPPEAEGRIPAFTELVATAIANAQAREDLRAVAEEHAALRRVATLVARAAPPAELFAAVAEEVGNVFPATDVAFVGRYDSAGGIDFVGGWGREVDPSFLGGRISLGGQNVTTLVHERNSPVRLDQLSDEDVPDTELARQLARSVAGAPIGVEGRLWGLMVVASRRAEGLPLGIEHRLADFTELLATAIANAEAREELGAIADEQAALRRVATLVAEGASPPDVFAAVAEEAGRLLPADVTILNRYDLDGTMVSIAGWSRTGEGLRIGDRGPIGGRDVAALVFETGRPTRIDSYDDDAGPLASRWIASAGLRSSVGVPISVEGRIWGSLVAASTTDQPLARDTEARLAGFTELVATAIANAQAQAELTASRARIVDTADETRRRIERDLHDGSQQRLVSLALRLRAAQAAVPSDLDELASELDRVAAGLGDALHELREYARGIHPPILAERGLGPALKTLVQQSPVPVQLDVRADMRLPERVELGAYYVVSEALTNAAKYANATSVAVGIEADDGFLRLSVRDDGVGGADFKHGSGLVGLKDRVEALGGRISLESPPGAGTSVRVELPLTGE